MATVPKEHLKLADEMVERSCKAGIDSIIILDTGKPDTSFIVRPDSMSEAQLKSLLQTWIDCRLGDV